MLEGKYRTKLKKKIQERLPGSIILSNDPSLQQGIPDFTVLYKDHWAFLEVKISKDASHRPNQEHFVERASEWSFGATIYPENETEVLNALQQSFESSR